MMFCKPKNSHSFLSKCGNFFGYMEKCPELQGDFPGWPVEKGVGNVENFLQNRPENRRKILFM